MDIMDFIDLKKNSGEENEELMIYFQHFGLNRSIHGESFRGFSLDTI